MLSDLVHQLFISAARDVIVRHVVARRGEQRALVVAAVLAKRVLDRVPDEHLSEKQLRMRNSRIKAVP